MKTIQIHRYGGPEVLQWEEVPVGEPGPNEARIRLKAVGLNSIDTYHRSGLYKLELPFVGGNEGAGEVTAVGEQNGKASFGVRWPGGETEWQAGWLIAEYGRQPWIIDGVLPTFLAASGLKLHQIMITLSGFVLIYTVLAVIEVWLMRKLILKGPEHLSAPQPDGEGVPQPAPAG